MQHLYGVTVWNYILNLRLGHAKHLFDATEYNVSEVCRLGQSVKIEEWAMPREDETVMEMYSEYKQRFENPGSLSDFVSNSMNDSSGYLAIYIPGGHGAMLGLPDNQDLSKLVNWSYDNDMFMMAICHGSAALLAAHVDGDSDSFVYKGYKIAAFPDAVDEQTPMIGYMPGHMPWKFGEKLNEIGVTIVNQEADNTCYVDRKLITGASPLAANEFGKISATAMLKEVNR